MTNIEIKLFIEGKRKYFLTGKLESNSLDGEISHAGYIARDKSSEFKRLIHYSGATPRKKCQKLVELAEKFYPGKDYTIQVNIKNIKK